MEVEHKPAVTKVTPATTTFRLAYVELLDAIRKGGIVLPEGGMFDFRFDPVAEKLTIIHTE